jgi:hypothetical protein
MIFDQLWRQLDLLRELLEKLTPEQYMRKTGFLSGASIGAHTRHIIELLNCAITGYESGEVDYVNRHRDFDLETNLDKALKALKNVMTDAEKSDKVLSLLAEGGDGDAQTKVGTTYFREIAYNAEHAVHHLALIKVALLEMNLNFIEPDFGMAESTLKYRASVAGQMQ